MILTAIISFVLGIKVGKNYSFQEAGFTQEDQQQVELKSQQEETVDNIAPTGEVSSSDSEGKKLNTQDASYKKLEEEFKKLETGEEPARPEPALDVTPTATNSTATPTGKDFDSLREKYVGKYTIQLGSFKTLDEGKHFADAFKLRGYNPIINEVDLKERGIWFRVSLGTFDSPQEAKTYIKKEQSLLQGQDYVIVKIN